jgi:hypothetical protein
MNFSFCDSCVRVAETEIHPDPNIAATLGPLDAS